MARLFYPILFAIALGAGTALLVGDRAHEVVRQFVSAIEGSATASDIAPTWPGDGYAASLTVSRPAAASQPAANAAVPWPVDRPTTVSAPPFTGPSASVPSLNVSAAAMTPSPPALTPMANPAAPAPGVTLSPAPWEQRPTNSAVSNAMLVNQPAAPVNVVATTPPLHAELVPLGQSPVVASGPPPYAAAPRYSQPPLAPGDAARGAVVSSPTPPPHAPAPATTPVNYQVAAAATAPQRDRYGYLIQPDEPPVREEDVLPTADQMAILRADTTEFSLFEENTRIIARVGGDVILAGEVMPMVNEVLERTANQVPPDQLDVVRVALIKQALGPVIDTKILAIEARRKIPAEALKQVEEKIKAAFDREELPTALDKSGAKSYAEMDARLRATGSSIDHERGKFVELTLAQMWRSQQIDRDPPVGYEEMVQFYREHATEYDHLPRARWEQIVIYFNSQASKAAAFQALAMAGNQVIDGAPFAAVARQFSKGPTAAQGGVMDWTSRGSLVSKPVDEALFSMPVGALSSIIEDERSFSIVRVIERQEAYRTPFEEAQGDIREAIRRKKIEAQLREYVDDVKSRTPVWTIFDAQPDARLTSRPAATTPAR